MLRARGCRRARRFGHGLEAGDGFGDRTVDVLLREGLAGPAEDHDFVRAGGQRALEALHVGRQHRVDRAGAARDARHHLGAVGHLRHPLGRDEGSRLDIGKAGGGQAVDQLHLDVGGHEFLFILQTVARRYFDDLDAEGKAMSLPVSVRASAAGTILPRMKPAWSGPLNAADAARSGCFLRAGMVRAWRGFSAPGRVRGRSAGRRRMRGVARPHFKRW